MLAIAALLFWSCVRRTARSSIDARKAAARHRDQQHDARPAAVRFIAAARGLQPALYRDVRPVGRRGEARLHFPRPHRRIARKPDRSIGDVDDTVASRAAQHRRRARYSISSRTPRTDASIQIVNRAAGGRRMGGDAWRTSPSAGAPRSASRILRITIALTDLPNRALFHEQLKRELACIAARPAIGGALHRHRRIQERQRFARPSDRRRTAEIGRGEPAADASGRADFVARLGGDEFAIVQTAVKIRRRRHRPRRRGFSTRSATPYECLGHQVTTDASIGIALAPQHGVDLDQILKNADLAMYAAKSAGRRTYRFFEPDMDAQVQARRILEMDLRQAITDGGARGLLSALPQPPGQQRSPAARRCCAGGIRNAA